MNYDQDFGEITAVTALPMREPAAIVVVSPVPEPIEPERTRPYRFPPVRVVLVLP